MFSPRNIRGVVISGVAVVAALTLTAGQSAAESGCFTVSGRYTEHAVTGPECRSPVGLCIAGTYRGDISGSLRGSANTVTPTADTPTTSVLTFTSDSTITGAVKGNRGTLVVKNAGVSPPCRTVPSWISRPSSVERADSRGRVGLSGPAERSPP